MCVGITATGAGDVSLVLPSICLGYKFVELSYVEGHEPFGRLVVAPLKAYLRERLDAAYEKYLAGGDEDEDEEEDEPQQAHAAAPAAAPALSEEEEREQSAAALKIQARARGRKARFGQKGAAATPAEEPGAIESAQPGPETEPAVGGEVEAAPRSQDEDLYIQELLARTEKPPGPA